MKSENRMTGYIVLTAAIITVFSFLEAALVESLDVTNSDSLE